MSSKLSSAKIPIPDQLRLVSKVYLLAIVIFTFFRLLLFLTNLDHLQSITGGKVILMGRAFLMGFRFDSVIAAYLLVLPYLLLWAVSFLKKKPAWLGRLILVYWALLFPASFSICTIDIPYFKHFYSRFSASVFSWLNTPGFIMKMVVQDVRFWIFFVVFLVISYIFIRLLKRWLKPWFRGEAAERGSPSVRKILLNQLLFLFCFLLIFVGMRGRLAKKSPIKVGTAYFSNHSFPNQLGLNPMFTFIRSLLDIRSGDDQWLRLPSNHDALVEAKQFLKLNETTAFESPLAREVRVTGPPAKHNVILVIMESMGASHLSNYGNIDRLTPNLDRLVQNSHTFDRVYSSGTHTYNGVYSSLFSFPTRLARHPLQEVSMLNYTGLANTLRNNGYQTIYFTTHDDQFDNIGGFLRANGFEQVVSQKDYPVKEVKSTLGVPDHFMFDFSLARIRELAGQKRPFLAVYLTGSYHPPFIVPENIPFEPRSRRLEHKIVEYADWSIGRLMSNARLENWFDDTVFIFVADHGLVMNARYELPLSRFHTPLIFHAPKIISENRRFQNLGGQMDIFPTLMNLLNISYVNNTMGVDLYTHDRTCIFFCDDERIGCLSDSRYLIMKNNFPPLLYNYPEKSVENLAQVETDTVDLLKRYVLSMLQSTEWMIRNRKVGKAEKIDSTATINGLIESQIK